VKELPLPPLVSTSTDAHEILRTWIADGNMLVALDLAFEDPEMWGVLLVDIARHVARSYVDTGRFTEAEALTKIRTLFDTEWGDPTDLGTTHDLRSN
jgi:hypothetical protein